MKSWHRVVTSHLSGFIAPLLILPFSVSASGDIVYRLTFDASQSNDGKPCAQYVTAPQDIVPATAAVEQIRFLRKKSAQIQTGPCDGFQGGQSLRWLRPGKDGDSGFLIRNSAKFYNLPTEGGLTLEAVIRVDSYEPGSSGGTIGIVTSGGAGGLSPALALVPGRNNTPAILFGIGWHKQSITYMPDQSLTGKWHHLAGVYKRNDGQGRSILRLYFDGALVSEKYYPQHAYQTFVFTGYSIAEDFPASANGRKVDGQIDAVALMDDVRDPETFVLPVAPKTRAKE